MEILTDEQINRLTLSEANSYIDKYAKELLRRQRELQNASSKVPEMNEIFSKGAYSISKVLKGQLGVNYNPEEAVMIESLRSARAKLRNLAGALRSDYTSVEGAFRVHARRVKAGEEALRRYYNVDVSKFTDSQKYKFWEIFHILVDEMGYASEEAIYVEGQLTTADFAKSEEEIIELIEEM